MKRQPNPEEVLQQACVKWYAMQYPKHNKCLFHVQQKARNSIEGAKFKKNGVVSGVSDLILLAPSGITYLIELKTPIGRQSDQQKEFQKQAENFEHRYLIARSLDEFIEIVTKIMPIKKYF